MLLDNDSRDSNSIPRSQPGGSPAPPIPIMIQEITNLYRAKIDVTKYDGLKIFRNATKGLADHQKFYLNVTLVRKFREHTENAAIQYNWGEQIFKFPSGGIFLTYSLSIPNSQKLM